MTATAVSIYKRPAGSPAVLKDALSKLAPSFAEVLPRHVTPERVVALTLLAATKQPDLLKCTPESIAGALMRISQWGLEIGTTAHLLTFNSKDKKSGEWRTECQAVADYKGLIQLALESGHVRDLYAELVYEADLFRMTKGSEPKLVHEPNMFVKDRGPLLGVYAVAQLRGQIATWEVLNVDQIEAIRATSKGKESGPWTQHYGEMAKKSAIRRLCKRLPQQSAKLRAVLDQEGNELPGFSVSPFMEVDAAPTRAPAIASGDEYGLADGAPTPVVRGMPARPSAEQAAYYLDQPDPYGTDETPDDLDARNAALDEIAAGEQGELVPAEPRRRRVAQSEGA